MKSLVLALFLSTTTAAHQHQHHRQHMHHHIHQNLPSFGHKPTFDQFLALDSAEREHQKLQMQAEQ